MTGVVALGGPAVLAGCSEVPEAGAGGTLQRVKDAGSIKVGIAGEVPYGYTEGDKVTGEAPEVAKAVFKAIGIDNVEATQVEFGQLIQALNAGQYDMVAAGMAILPDRCENAQFSAVDYVTPTAFMVPKGNPKGINNFDDLKAKGETIAVLSGTVEQSVAEALGIPSDKIQPYDGQPELFQALKGGRAYCGALTDISLRRLLEDNSDAPFEVTEGFVPTIDGKEQIQAGGFVFRKGDDDLVDAFNTELTKLQESGEWLKIVEPFGFTADNEVPDDVKTEKLCEAA
ncbi:MAG: ectoine/hydroxyectoine ABC transporter substrate-binding protein EhuB [Actinophytocola sp.]|uniref:ectoine/hydroxyectoine ABC transporter substrate-binding protein EhuB n=1 Tax=Actinophytocola sp. TaxID=1872138 RepID=UPI0013268C59|nr:ectoine/hydroxyectoine ABC transporter substrate-binding protein EhuB [Actinophytocola sp.]MPZ82940.1 ectoine/hydroxyectoine ABC transporter substrate-binding protein EhuB [Actinophytocola sp.]